MPDDVTRPSLLLRIRDRDDADAWRAFDAIYRPMLGRFARCQGLGDADADDVTQHCLLAVAEHIRGFAYDPAKGRFKSWLRTLVNNRIRTLARRRPLPAVDASRAARQPADGPEPADLFDRLWAEEHLWHCMREVEADVGPETFAAFRAYVIDGRPADDVARELGLTRQNLYTIKWRLTQRIAARMRELDGAE